MIKSLCWCLLSGYFVLLSSGSGYPFLLCLTKCALYNLYFICMISQDDTTFEKQSALFALAVSDIVLINMWCHDIGREQAANKPLLKTVFQVMMRLFSPRKTTLLFVIRDKSKTPLENLEPILREDIQKIWDAVPKPHAHKETPLSEFFNVEVVALSSYEEKEELFKEQVSHLRDRFQHSIAPGGLAGDRSGVVPASGFSFSSQQFWKVIKENKDLDLPAHKVMVATVRCEEIGNQKASSFTADEEWQHIEEAVQHDYVPGFGKKLNNLLDKCLSEYDMEAIYFDEGVRSSKRQQLESKLLQLVNPAYQSLLGHLRIRTLEAFKESFDKALEKDGFAVVARNCTRTFLENFDKGSEGSSDGAARGVGGESGVPRGASEDSGATRGAVEGSGAARDTGKDSGAVRGVTEPEQKASRALGPGKRGQQTWLLTGAENEAHHPEPGTATTRAALTMGRRRMARGGVDRGGTVGEDRPAHDRNHGQQRRGDAQANVGHGVQVTSGDKGVSTRRRWRGKGRGGGLRGNGACGTSLRSDGLRDAAIQLAKWDSSKIKDKLKRDIEAHVVLVRASKLSELCAKYEAQLTKALAEPVEALLDSASEDTWPAIRQLLQRETKAAISGLESALAAFELDEATEKELLQKLENHGRGVVESKAKEEAGRVLIRMKDRFSTLFSRDADSMPRMLNIYCALHQEANKRNNNWLPPPWALAAMAILGFNEFMTLLRNPLYLAVIFIVFLVGKAFWLPAILSLSTKFVPTIMNILKRLADEGHRPAAPERQREMELQPTNSSSHSNVTSAGSSSVTASEIGPEYSSPVAK
ncbi:hypothetical protein PR202_gb08552 [Eleusine coracana subsp. coracana]|uniref:GB1/RHD3-type G domain-containing protein n=1 Tax=Eleusine coracana subsp. coracana TaxID=191504 RepID=A0AAV5ECJ3_ELECO|nr:hypothetical protein PR202_gb08552 [Eleusine coracana subsp. coracana]